MLPNVFHLRSTRRNPLRFKTPRRNYLHSKPPNCIPQTLKVFKNKNKHRRMKSAVGTYPAGAQTSSNPSHLELLVTLACKTPYTQTLTTSLLSKPVTMTKQATTVTKKLERKSASVRRNSNTATGTPSRQSPLQSTHRHNVPGTMPSYVHHFTEDYWSDTGPKLLALGSP